MHTSEQLIPSYACDAAGITHLHVTQLVSTHACDAAENDPIADSTLRHNWYTKALIITDHTSIQQATSVVANTLTLR